MSWIFNSLLSLEESLMVGLVPFLPLAGVKLNRFDFVGFGFAQRGNSQTTTG